jgi:hypothetical protein
MAIADIFEALIATDRPYREWQTPLGGPGDHGLHGAGAALDADLFALFLRSGVPQLYAQSFLPPHQIDGVDVEALLGGS